MPVSYTHLRYFLDHVAGWILELDRGEGIPWKGNYSSWLEQEPKRMEMEEKAVSYTHLDVYKRQEVLRTVNPQKVYFVLCDACRMGCAEVYYELKDAARYRSVPTNDGVTAGRVINTTVGGTRRGR